jgi:hypothetical protein
MDSETRRRITFPGHFDWDTDEASSFVCTIEYAKYDPTSLSVRLLLLGDEDRLVHSRRGLENWAFNYLHLHSDRPEMPSVDILGIRGPRLGFWEAEIDAGAVEIGITDTPLATGTTCWSVVQLTPSGILSPWRTQTCLPTGEIQRSGGLGGAVQIATPLGTLSAEEQSAYYDSHEYGDEVTHVVERAIIRGEINVSARRGLREIHESLISQIDDICLILSLCYRQRVRYYEISYSVHDEIKGGQFREPTLRLKQDACVQKRQIDELVHYRDLVDGGLDSLIRAFQNIRDPAALRRSIVFLSASFEAESVESCYFFAYSALESVVSTVDSSPRLLLSESQWKKTQGFLKQQLDRFVEERGISDVVEMKAKLMELRRTPAARHIEKICRDLGVKTDDLWPRHGFTAGVKLATNLRNDLFHSALCTDDRQLHAHLTRLRVLAERIILKILGWPDDKLWAHHDYLLKWTNKGDVASQEHRAQSPSCE